MDINQILATNIRHLRDLKKISQAQLAEELDLSLNAVGRIERGLLSPSLKTIQNICFVCKISASELFDVEFPQNHTIKDRSNRASDLLQINSVLVRMTDKEIRQASKLLQALK